MSANSAGTTINAVGIDAPLFWNPAGDRRADQIVQKAITQLGGPDGTVKSINSLRGPCLIQGILVTMICRQKSGNGIPITEAHPKALLRLIRKVNPVGVTMGDLGEYVVRSEAQGGPEHEKDAALGEVAAFAMGSRRSGWRDLTSSNLTRLRHRTRHQSTGCLSSNCG
jgi:predicted nuclease with RNAse H fold